MEEGIAFQESIKSETPVYRLINTKTKEHYFTADNDLANKMITEQAKEGWQNDTTLAAYQHDTTSKTIAFYSADDSAENIPVLSLHNSEAGIGQNFYTASSDEADIAKSEFDWKVSGSFKQEEGVAWYALGHVSSDMPTSSIKKEAAYTVTTTPSVHSVVSFKAGQFGFSPQYGHVAFVEAVNLDGSILVSESGLGYSSLYVYQVFTADEAAQLHYVVGK